MKVSLNLAQEYSNVDLNKIGTEKLLQKIGAQLGAVDEVIYTGQRYDKAVVAKIISCVQHPNADRLHVCMIDDGGVTKDVKRDEKGHVQVVCGAPNAREGITVAWLPPTSTVPSSYDKDPFVLEARELRGVVSNGMLASPAELGIGDNHDGILEIEDFEGQRAKGKGQSIKPGTPLKELYGLDDVIVDCENKMFTHRPDCFGTLGVARELAGIQQLKFKSPDWYLYPLEIKNNHSEHIKSVGITVETPEIVPAYSLIAIDNVKVAPSPTWLQAYLARVGIRPINNIVDMTNYMMMLTGQPLHAFDFDKVAKNGDAQIVVRKPKSGEKLTLLDGKTITPRDDAILICDLDKPIALGGIMGGNNSEIDSNTTRILIECASFDMYNVRKTSMEHGIFTDAVTRFNKGQSPWQCEAVLAKAASMVQELSRDAKTIGKPVVLLKTKAKNDPIKISADFINSRLGSKLSLKDIASLLENVEFKVASVPADKNHIHITAPFWRMDIESPEDIVEEIGRLYGYDKLPIELPARSAKAAEKDEHLELKREIRGFLAEAGANEVLTYSFVHGNLLSKVGQPETEAYALRNALSPDLQYFRLSLTPSLLDKVNMNLRVGYDKFAIFELNKTHVRMHGETEEKVPAEINMVTLVYAANDKTAPEGAAFYQARKYLDFLAHKLGIKLKYEALTEDPPYPVTKPFDWQRSALVSDAETGTLFGQIGEYREEVRRNLKLPEHSAGFELSLEAFALSCKPLQYQAASRFPSQTQDITLEVEANVQFGTINSEVETIVGELSKAEDFVYKVEPIDIYKPDDNKLRYSYRVTLTHLNRTLKTEEVNKLLEEVASSLKSSLSAERI